MCESVGKANLLSDHFDGKQSRESVDLPLTCHLSPKITSFAFRSSEVRRLLFDMYPYEGSDPLGMFPLFLKRTAEVLAPRLSVVFRRLVCLGSFPACWRQANVTPIKKGPQSSSVANYRPISITSLLSQHVMVDGCRSKLVNVLSGVPQGSVLGMLLFLLGAFLHSGE